jgi:hypothetical protein
MSKDTPRDDWSAMSHRVMRPGVSGRRPGSSLRRDRDEAPARFLSGLPHSDRSNASRPGSGRASSIGSVPSRDWLQVVERSSPARRWLRPALRSGFVPGPGMASIPARSGFVLANLADRRRDPARRPESGCDDISRPEHGRGFRDGRDRARRGRGRPRPRFLDRFTPSGPGLTHYFAGESKSGGRWFACDPRGPRCGPTLRRGPNVPGAEYGPRAPGPNPSRREISRSPIRRPPPSLSRRAVSRRDAGAR